MSDYVKQPSWASDYTRPGTDKTVLLYQQNPPPPDLQTWDDEWNSRASSPGPSRNSPTLWQRLVKLALIVGTVFLLLAMVGGVAYALVGQSMLEDWYLEQEPYVQEVWCLRFEKYLRSSYLCDLRNEAARPDNPFVPTMAPDDGSISPDDLLLTPLFPEGDGESTGSGGEPDVASSTPEAVSAQPTEASTPVPAEATVTATQLPTLPPTATLIPSPTFTPTIAPPPASAQLDLSRITPEYQGWNNCGPTTLTMGLTYFGYQNDQYPAAAFLKPNREDKNVNPWEMTRFVNEEASTATNVRALYRIGGTLELLKSLVAAGYPVVVEKGYEPEGYDWMGHYLLLVGYDDAAQEFITFDSFLGSNDGRGRRETYSYTNYYWQHFNYTFIVLYEPWQQDQLYQVLGNYSDENWAVSAALERARTEANADSVDKWAWFNLGDAYTRLGLYDEAASAFDRAFDLNMPWRTIWYRFGPFEAYYHVGRYNDVIQLTNTLDQSSQQYVEEAWYYRGLAYAAQGNYDQAIVQLQRVLRFNQNYTQAGEAISQINTGTFVPPVS